MEKILFIVPPYVSFDNFVNPTIYEATMLKHGRAYKNVVADMPLGFLSLSAYLKEHTDAEIKCIDFNITLNKLDTFEFDSFSELFSEILSGDELIEFAPTIIGISSLFVPSYLNTLDLAEVGRRTFPEAFIMAGGSVATTMYKEIYSVSDNFDALCYGEGELPLLGLVKADNKKEFAKDNASWVTKEKVESQQSFEHDYIWDLDEIPFFDYDLLELEGYRLNPMLGNYPLMKDKLSSIPVITTRGCPFKCNFCSSHAVHGRQMRYHSVARLKRDFERLKEKFGIVAIMYMDDHFMAKKRRVYEIIDVMKELQLTAYFPSSVTLISLDRKMLEALKSIGVDNLVLSVESGSDRVLKELMHKPLNLEVTRQVTADCRELGINADINIVVGVPGETKQDLQDTRSFLKTVPANWFRINVATPLKGSEMFETAEEGGYLKGDYTQSNYKTAIIETEDWTSDEIQDYAYALNLELNFVENDDLRLKEYERALEGFLQTLKLKHDHAFGLYFAAVCYKRMNIEDQFQVYRKKYEEVLGGSTFWQHYSERFNLPALQALQ